MIQLHQIILNDDFDLTEIFNCGQAFRWHALDSQNSKNDQCFEGIVEGQWSRICQKQNQLTIEVIGLATGANVLPEAFWIHYFDLSRSYADIRAELAQREPLLKDALDFGQGLRLLNQSPFEMLMTFIVSANNNIPRIEKSIQALSKTFGTPILPFQDTSENTDLKTTRTPVGYAFPKAEALAAASLEEVRACGVGYRDRYIVEAAQKWIAVGGEGFGQSLLTMEHEVAKASLMTFPGVGAKVADCILLFCAGQHDAFPIDTWMTKALNRYYSSQLQGMKAKQIAEFIENRFGTLKGFAQQYIFHYERNGLIK